jgi:magnesium-transporting ATPase (P-type)
VGHEGTAAAQSADFAFSQFRYLRRALLVHGTWYYRRLAFVVQYSFYKNVACFTCQLMFAAYSNFSGMTLYDSLFLFLFNTLYASVPVMVYGLSEQFLQQETLLQQPSLYRLQRGNSLMNVKQLLKWFCLGLWHAAVCFFGWVLIWPESYPSDDLYGFGAIVACTSVLVVNAKILIEARYWSWPLVLSVVLSVISYVVITLLEQQFLVESSLLDNTDQFRTYLHVIYLPPTWLGTLLLVVTALLPDVLLQVWDHMHMSSIAAVSAVAAESYGKTASPFFI